MMIPFPSSNRGTPNSNSAPNSVQNPESDKPPPAAASTPSMVSISESEKLIHDAPCPATMADFAA